MRQKTCSPLQSSQFSHLLVYNLWTNLVKVVCERPLSILLAEKCLIVLNYLTAEFFSKRDERSRNSHKVDFKTECTCKIVLSFHTVIIPD